MVTQLRGGTDRELIQACRRGDERAWEALVKKYRHLVYSIPHRIGLSEDEASDVFQAVFLALLRNLGALRQDETLVPWLVTTTKRESWKVGRKRAREGSAGDPSNREAEWPPPTAPLEQLERQIAVRAALDRLDTRCRRLLEALFYEDPTPSYRTLSRRMKIPVPSIGPTRIRCLEKLRRELKALEFF